MLRESKQISKFHKAPTFNFYTDLAPDPVWKLYTGRKQVTSKAQRDCAAISQGEGGKK
jgi:hypothetical protein